VLAYLAETYFGIADITGAYVAGVILCNLADRDYIEKRVDISSYMIFAPVFFAGIGLKTSFGAMDTRLIFFSICFVGIALAAKVIGCGGCARLLGFDRHESLCIGAGMMTRGEVALIVAQRGLKAGIIDSRFFTAVILLIVISSILTPVLLKSIYAVDEKQEAAMKHCTAVG
jgi:Kef-type K+ transport system membrane component KefB